MHKSSCFIIFYDCIKNLNSEKAIILKFYNISVSTLINITYQ